MSIFCLEQCQHAASLLPMALELIPRYRTMELDRYFPRQPPAAEWLGYYGSDHALLYGIGDALPEDFGSGQALTTQRQEAARFFASARGNIEGFKHELIEVFNAMPSRKLQQYFQVSGSVRQVAHF